MKSHDKPKRETVWQVQRATEDKAVKAVGELRDTVDIQAAC